MADDTVDAEVQRLRFVELEQLGHQLDKVRLGLLEIGHGYIPGTVARRGGQLTGR
ncbi:MAG: hypothetical protein KDI69_03760 [Xanthomonadales bacterium]|nr:hypothetical protein [Xanthomonadales bacterium]